MRRTRGVETYTGGRKVEVGAGVLSFSFVGRSLRGCQVLTAPQINEGESFRPTGEMNL